MIVAAFRPPAAPKFPALRAPASEPLIMPRGTRQTAQRPHGHASGPLGTASQIRNPAPALPLQQRVSLFIAYVNKLTRSWKQAPLGTACQIRTRLAAKGTRGARPGSPS